MRIAFRAAIALQVAWMAIVPGQHLLSHADVDPSATPCPELSTAGDSAPAPWSSGHSACVVCLVLASGTCLPPTAAPVFFELAGNAGEPLASPAPLLAAEPASSLQARAPPLV